MADANFADKTIWTGDNLDILRGMNSECVNLIYLVFAASSYCYTQFEYCRQRQRNNSGIS